MTMRKVSVFSFGMMTWFRPQLTKFSPRLGPKSTKQAMISSINTAIPSSTTNMNRIIPKPIRISQAIHPSNDIITIQGWVQTVRKQKNIAFVEINDGSNGKGMQCVIEYECMKVGNRKKQVLESLTTGTSIQLNGLIIPSNGKHQSIELKVKSFKIIGSCPSCTYPLAKKRHTLEYLRSLTHLRPRTNTIASVARIRSTLFGSIHDFYQNQGFLYIPTPVITSQDCEGAGELFRVTTFDLQQPTGPNQPLNYKDDFFGKPTYLTVSSQLHLESHACALGNVYTLGPTFRADNSQTTRHLSEFHMLESELAFADIHMTMEHIENLLKHVIRELLTKCDDDLQFLERYYERGLRDKLRSTMLNNNQPFLQVSYADVIRYLKEEQEEKVSNHTQDSTEVQFGINLTSQQEKWLTEEKFPNQCVFVYDYPRDSKSFYMRDNDVNTTQPTVKSMDLLVPGIGELVGGSQREERFDVLLSKMNHHNINLSKYEWYSDLRKYGSIPHAGYGLGFERLVCYVTGMKNIRESVAFPRYVGHAEF